MLALLHPKEVFSCDTSLFWYELRLLIICAGYILASGTKEPYVGIIGLLVWYGWYDWLVLLPRPVLRPYPRPLPGERPLPPNRPRPRPRPPLPVDLEN